MSRKRNNFFQFKQFRIQQESAGMKVTTDACLLGGLVSTELVPKTILDIGVGTGLLALMLAQKFPTARIDGVELDISSYNQALENVKNSPWEDRIALVNTSIQEFDSERKYDLIISNPPFFHRSLSSPDNQVNLARHDQSLGQEELARQIENRLEPDGSAYILYPEAEQKRFVELLGDLCLNELISLYNHPGDVGKRIFRQVSRVSFKNKQQIKSALCIRNKSGNYSASFIELLEDYYLHL